VAGMHGLRELERLARVARPTMYIRKYQSLNGNKSMTIQKHMRYIINME
jgi:hypothetical protein